MSTLSTSSADCCWICFQEDGEIVQACRCPRGVHLDCLAYWCLHQAGNSEETACRFCSSPVPDWKDTLAGGKHTAHLQQVPVVAVLFEGREWRLRVPPTPEGRLRFQRQVELLTGVPFHEQTHVKFHCKTPKGKDVSLSGTRCLEAAIHCAALHCAHHHQAQEEGAQHPQMLQVQLKENQQQQQQQVEQHVVTSAMPNQKVLQLLTDALPPWPQQQQQQQRRQQQQQQQQQLMSPRAMSLLQQDVHRPQHAETQPQLTPQSEATLSAQLHATASSRLAAKRVTAALRRFKKLGQLALFKHVQAC